MSKQLTEAQERQALALGLSRLQWATDKLDAWDAGFRPRGWNELLEEDLAALWRLSMVDHIAMLRAVDGEKS